jgi:beta-galactosidase
MKKQLLIVMLCVIFVFTSRAQRSQFLFDSSWKFFRGEVADGEKQTTSDANWRVVELPHDWSIEDLPGQSDSVIGPFTTKSVGTTSTGYVVGGTAWYRRHFRLNNIVGKEVSIYFDGVYMNSDVWINEHHLGNHPYGYTPFYYDLTPYLKTNGEENVLAVRVRNDGKNSRWYSGSGIYRHVWLFIKHTVNIEQWGIYITTPATSSTKALVNVKTTINTADAVSSLKLVTRIVNSKQKTVAVVETLVSLNARGREISQNFTITRPLLWSPESPYLYKAISDITQGDQVIDEVVTPFGIRTLDFSAEKGFLLNGKSVELRGGCMHHDNGPLGAAAIDRAEERRVELLKNYGFNAVRTSHNPPSQQFLDACDRVGIIVLDEAFDHWQREKNPQDYHLYFDTSWKKDIDAMVLRDRNHPSVVFWSIGNEINERADAPGLELAKQLMAEIKLLDDTRPVTEAICHFWDHPGYKWDTTAAAFALLDLGGYNYQWKEYESDHKKFPQRIMMGTESVPKEAFDNWKLVEQHPYIIGDFVWTAMDYLGETGIGHTKLDSASSYQLQRFPWFNAWCGDIDLTGGKKPQLFYRDIIWRTSPMHMLVHSPIPTGHNEAVSYWGWPDEIPYYHFTGQEGKPVQVHVYTRYPEVRLKLNGTVIDQKAVSPDNLTATFEINYQPGSLTAVAIKNGKSVDSVTLRTAGKPTKIRLSADRSRIKANRNDLAYVTAEILDAEGHLVPDAIIPLQFSIAGNGEIAATASASPNDMQSFQKPQHRTFRGKCLIIVRPSGKAGKITLKATGDGVTGDDVVIETR